MLYQFVDLGGMIAYTIKLYMAQPVVFQEGLFIGAAVTQASLIDYLLEASSAAQRKHGSSRDNGHVEGPQGGVPGVYSALAHHLQRVAGNPVSPVGR